ncbi:MAG: hypothetical protein NWE94_01055 [Candidatus Bathyarchaeota archaeon]|nr:hypothetical protein [Candidatus Bathyarchaeota archaeon]
MKKKALAVALIWALLSVTANFCGTNAVPVQTGQSSASTRQFDVDFLYAYIESGAYYIGTVVFNVTRVSGVPLSSEGMIEVYKAEVLADGQLIGCKTVGWQIGKGLSADARMGYAMSLGSFYGTTACGLQDIGIPINPYLQEPLNLVEPVSVIITRLGWISVNGDDVHSRLSVNETLQQVQLETFGDGFLYNALVPTEQLQLIDPLRPVDTLNSTSPNPSPSQEPTSPQETKPEIFPITLVLAPIDAIVAASAGLLVYLRKRKRQTYVGRFNFFISIK